MTVAEKAKLVMKAAQGRRPRRLGQATPAHGNRAFRGTRLRRCVDNAMAYRGTLFEDPGRPGALLFRDRRR